MGAFQVRTGQLPWRVHNTSLCKGCSHIESNYPSVVVNLVFVSSPSMRILQAHHSLPEEGIPTSRSASKGLQPGQQFGGSVPFLRCVESNIPDFEAHPCLLRFIREGGNNSVGTNNRLSYKVTTPSRSFWSVTSARR